MFFYLFILVLSLNVQVNTVRRGGVQPQTTLLVNYLYIAIPYFTPARELKPNKGLDPRLSLMTETAREEAEKGMEDEMSTRTILHSAEGVEWGGGGVKIWDEFERDEGATN